jgi:hypothetical protein
MCVILNEVKPSLLYIDISFPVIAFHLHDHKNQVQFNSTIIVFLYMFWQKLRYVHLLELSRIQSGYQITHCIPQKYRNADLTSQYAHLKMQDTKRGSAAKPD